MSCLMFTLLSLLCNAASLFHMTFLKRNVIFYVFLFYVMPVSKKQTLLLFFKFFFGWVSAAIGAVWSASIRDLAIVYVSVWELRWRQACPHPCFYD